MKRAILWMRLMWVGVKWTVDGTCANGQWSRWAIFKQALRFAGIGSAQ